MHSRVARIRISAGVGLKDVSVPELGNYEHVPELHKYECMPELHAYESVPELHQHMYLGLHSHKYMLDSHTWEYVPEVHEYEYAPELHQPLCICARIAQTFDEYVPGLHIILICVGVAHNRNMCRSCTKEEHVPEFTKCDYVAELHII